MGMGKKLLNWTMKKERMQKEALSPLSSRSPKKDMGVWKWDFPHKLMIFFLSRICFFWTNGSFDQPHTSLWNGRNLSWLLDTLHELCAGRVNLGWKKHVW
jgi:hypothetical protein